MKNKLLKNLPQKKIEEKISSTSEKKVQFTFKYLDREHELFNLGDSPTNPQVVEKEWFLDLLDCLKRASKMDINEFLQDKSLDTHPVKWEKANAKKPEILEQAEFWQFRISKSRGRIIGVLIESTFHIVWLDRHHNLTNSKGYGEKEYFYKPDSLYEIQESKIKFLESENEKLLEEIETYKEIFEQYDTGRNLE